MRLKTSLTATVPLWPLLVINALLLLVPKLLLIQWLNQNLWGDIGAGKVAIVISQDTIVALGLYVLTITVLRIPGFLRLLVAATVSGALLLFMLIDMRVRQLWLKPLDASMVRYFLENAAGLKSGFDFFFRTLSVYSLNFDRVLVYAALLFALLWSSIAASVLSGRTSMDGGWTRARAIAAGSATLILIGLALSASQFRYQVNNNIFTSQAIAWMKTPFAQPDTAAKALADAFEQKPQPLNSQLQLSRKILTDVQPFKNLVFIVYESMRWRNINILGEGPTLAPTLYELATGGIVSKCYVAVPHSAKAYYTLFTGRYPYPGIEMREVVQKTNATIWQYLLEYRHMKSYAISSQSLNFESMGALLKSFGMDPYMTQDLPGAKGKEVQRTSSFGTSDKALYTLGSQFLSKSSGAFAAFFFPLAAHYPYECSGSDTKRHRLPDYEACVAESDRNLAEFLAALRRMGLLQDTLLVIVGDHGESFGEHGTYVHNSSLNDEEVSVPLVFWSQDGRLGHHYIPYSRQIDIVPTIADLMGAMDSTIPVQGVSVLRQRNMAVPNFMATFFDNLSAAIEEPPYKYIYEQSTGRLLAFNDVTDPLERTSLTLSAADQKVLTGRIRSFVEYQRLAFPVD